MNAASATSPRAAIRIGPAGWSYPDWKGTVYPNDMPKSLHPLTFLAQRFDTIEINTTFYRPVAPRMSASWIQKAAGNPRFKFTAKLWERFTHAREAFPPEADVTLAREGFMPLLEAGRLGAVLIQFPWNFRRTPENRVWLARVFDAFQMFPLAIEVRHDSWETPELYEGLSARGITYCNIDQPLIDRSIAPSGRLTSQVGYVRLHGRNTKDWFRKSAGRDERYDYLYSMEELTPWVHTIRGMREKASEIYVVTNNHFQGQAVLNALQLTAALKD